MKNKSAIVSLLLILILFSACNQKENINTPKLKEITPFTYCAIEVTGSWNQYNDAVLQLEQEVKKQNIAVSGNVISIWRSYPDITEEKDYNWEVGFKVSKETALKSPLVLKHWKTKKLYSQTYDGAAKGVTSFFKNYWSWFDTNKLKVVRPLLEIGVPKKEVGEGESKFEALVFAVKKD